MKIFEEELIKLHKKLSKKEIFSFSKYADGEWAVINGEFLNNGEFKNDPSQDFYRQKLLESFQFKDKNYTIGISCECCQGIEHDKMKKLSGQDEENLTFANIFVNSNYPLYKSLFIEEYKKNDIYLVCNEHSKVENLPFKVEKTFPITYNAWVNNYNLIKDILSEEVTGKLFLFCAGPFGNILAHQLYQSNKNNIYLDIGSTLNPWLQSEAFKRDYYCDRDFAKRTCVWN
jgi:hypothetical protein